MDSSVYDVGVRGRRQVPRIIESFHKILLTRTIENPNHFPMQKSYQIDVSKGENLCPTVWTAVSLIFAASGVLVRAAADPLQEGGC